MGRQGVIVMMSTVKRVKIDDVRAMAAEPLNEWLDNLPRDDVQHVALHLYSNNLVFRKPLQLLSSDVGLMILYQMMESSLTHSRVTSLETRH